MKTFIASLITVMSLGQGAIAAENMVLTPIGYRPSSSVHMLRRGQGLRQINGTMMVTEANQTILPPFPSLSQSHDSGWITTSLWQIESGDSVASFTSTWQVPPAPTEQSGQTIFLFNGIMNQARTAILQPVLQWGQAANGGGAYWAIASWYVGSDGTFYTQPVQVNPGSPLTGVMNLISQSNGSFSYTSEFVGVSGTSLPVNNIDELVWLSETLEAYGVNDCSQYPLSKVAFTGVGIKTTNNKASLNWTVDNSVTDCNQSTTVVNGSSTDGEVDISMD